LRDIIHERIEGYLCEETQDIENLNFPVKF